jgi:hypothetical protein
MFRLTFELDVSVDLWTLLDTFLLLRKLRREFALKDEWWKMGKDELVEVPHIKV